MEYFIYKDGRQQGPFTPEQLATEGISSETLVWSESLKSWTPAWQVAELKGIVDGEVKPKPVPPPINDNEKDEAARETQANAAAEDKETVAVEVKPTYDKRRHKAVIRLAVAAVVFLVLLLTCPDKGKHRDAIADVVTDVIKEKAYGIGTDGGSMDMIGGMLYDMIAPRLVNTLVDQFVEVDNYFIFSVGKLSYGDKSKTVSFGILGHVFTFDSEDIGKMLDNGKPMQGTMAL